MTVATAAHGDRRRPSLSNVLTGDSNDPTVQQALAMKLASAAADLANDDGGAPRALECAWPEVTSLTFGEGTL